MKKTIALIFTILLCATTLLGCDTSNTTIDYQTTYNLNIADNEFELLTDWVGATIFDSNNFALYRHKLTDVIYIAYQGRHEISFTPMIDKDGKPLLYDEWLKLSKEGE